MMTKRICAAFGCAAVLLLSGCALTPETIALSYKPQTGVTAVPTANTVTAGVTVLDQRLDKTKVSSKKNGYGMEMAPITAAEDVTITVRKALETELKARGFALGDKTATVQIASDLTRFSNDHKTGFFSGESVADLSMLVNVKSANGSIGYSQVIAAQGIEPKIQMMGGENARLALDRALSNAMTRLFEDKAFIAAVLAASTPK